MTPAIAILAAIDALNSWVRSDSHRDWSMESPRYAIYDWKHDAIARAVDAGQAACRAIYLTLYCRDCGGKGHYTDSSGFTFPHCRRCSSTGKSKLTFLESTISGYCWHTPWDKVWNIRRLPEGLYEHAELSTDWEPNAKGKDLTLPEVAMHLNTLEDAALRGELRKPGSHGVYDYGNWIGDSRHERYRLFLGRSERVCELCGKPAVLKDDRGFYDGVHHHVSRAHVSWCAWACNACKALYATRNEWSDQLNKYVPAGGNGKSIFDEFKPPRVDDPEVLKWLERRMAQSEVAA